ncbi:uncharacterized protein LOC132273551 [Cornus florida]|uniref:uncharacterized protein LOC132273551 n=1 Tax=Cornus florida TaxID=4283 RepID=UPI002898C839|nr:uncharacterized protein LOC132273551 [Cornus florida]
MMGNQNIVAPTESSAIVSRGVNSTGNDNQNNKNRPRCDHCHKTGHTRDTCWKIHGKPADWKPKNKWQPPPEREGRGFTTTTDEQSPAETTLFSKEQMDLLQKIFSQSQSNSNIGTGSIAQKGLGFGGGRLAMLRRVRDSTFLALMTLLKNKLKVQIGNSNEYPRSY